jgi:hypothetical protein
VLEQALQQRQRERRRLAGAGLGRAHHVLAGQHHGMACAWMGVMDS